MARGIEQSLAEARIPASVSILLRDGAGFTEILQRESAGADIVFLGLKITEAGEEEKQVDKLEGMAGVAKIVVFMKNNSMKETLPILLPAQ